MFIHRDYISYYIMHAASARSARETPSPHDELTLTAHLPKTITQQRTRQTCDATRHDLIWRGTARHDTTCSCESCVSLSWQSFVVNCVQT